jgi:hypothetical protein
VLYDSEVKHFGGETLLAAEIYFRDNGQWYQDGTDTPKEWHLLEWMPQGMKKRGRQGNPGSSDREKSVSWIVDGQKTMATWNRKTVMALSSVRIQ